MRSLLLLALLAPTACADRKGSTPTVDPSAEAKPSRGVAVLPGGDFLPGCLVVEAGRTLEFSNETPELAADVTSLIERTGGEERTSAELYSPNLLAPAPTRWRHTFGRPGVFTFANTAAGSPGRKVVDGYYGTVSYVAVPGASVPTGTVCVHGGDPAECAGVCCPGGDTECAGRTECLDGACHPYPAGECRRAGDCPAGLVCGPKGRCIAQCRSARDCPADSTCEGGRCRAPAEGTPP